MFSQSLRRKLQLLLKPKFKVAQCYIRVFIVMAWIFEVFFNFASLVPRPLTSTILPLELTCNLPVRKL